jgi:lysophospholipase
VTESSGAVRTADGLDLALREWPAAEPRGAIVLVHGLAEHTGRYLETAEHFAGQGWSVYAADLRGHGLSPDGHRHGRVHVRRFGDYLLDVDAVRRHARSRHARIPLYVLGHSMGGLVSLSYLLEYPGAFAGGIISSPALAPHPDALPPRHVLWIARLLSWLRPWTMFPSEVDPEDVSRDPAVVRAYAEDPLISRTVSARWFITVTRAMKMAHKNASQLAEPVLLMQSGADRLVDPAAPERWARLTPPKRVEYVAWEGLFHEMLNEPEKDQVRARITQWLTQGP